MKTIAIANNKGGCGKTATTYCLGKLLAEMGISTLLVDLDPQANLTEALLLADNPAKTIADVLGGAAPESGLDGAIWPVAGPNVLWLCPSEFQLANTALGLLNDAVKGRTALRRALRLAPAYIQCVLIDCPPEAGILLANALFAADGVILPAEAEEAAFAGVRRVVEMADFIRSDRESETPAVLGMIATRIDSRTTRHQDGIEQMEASSIPLLGVVRERNGASRERDLLNEYRPIANGLAAWIMGVGDARPTEDE
jgi:chromosome partitioning protein